MAKREVNVRPVRVHYDCDHCGGGMKAISVQPTAPLSYRHRCSKCGKVAVFEQSYPRIEYREIPGES